MGRDVSSITARAVMALAVYLVATMVVVTKVRGDTVYACLGGCYNECILLNGRGSSDSFSCYYKCISSCIPRSSTTFNNNNDNDSTNNSNNYYYCQLGCSLQLCFPLTDDGKRNEKCFGRCHDGCTV